MSTLNEKFSNVCFTIYSEIKHLELYLELLREFEKNASSGSELIKIIKNSIGHQIVTIFSRIVEGASRNSANIFYIRNFVNSEIGNISGYDKEILKRLLVDIDNFAEEYANDIKIFEDVKDVKISHNDLKLAKLGQTKTLNFSLTRMTEITNKLIEIFKKFIPEDKDNFSPEFIKKIKNEVAVLFKDLNN